MTFAELARFPDAIHIKTPTRSFNLFFYFALDRDGRIWFKSIPGASLVTDNVAVDWKLFQGTGLPDDAVRTQFVRPRRIESINADLDELVAISDDHLVYSLRWFENPVFKEQTPAKVWADEHGWPVAGPLRWDARVARHRGWAIGRRTRNLVMFEDITGRTFDGGGGLSTMYVLLADGTSIAFTDTGLPPDFSHTIGGPDRSTFVAEEIDVSADTIFLINAYGELRTRMIDFDTNGSASIFFEYTYDRRPTNPDAIAIPAEDWFAHKPIPLVGQAQIGMRISIALTGKHNRDRELRVAGYDPDRRPGYYAKRIFDQVSGSPLREDRDEWRFEADDSVPVDPDLLLDPADTDPSSERAAARLPVPVPRWTSAPKPPRRVPARDMDFDGELVIDGEVVDVEASVLGFHLDGSPSRLRFAAHGESIEITLHTIEKWYHLRRFDPGRDGTPQEFQATVEIDVAAKTITSPLLRGLVCDAFGPYNLVSFAFFAQATEDYLEIEGRNLLHGKPRLALRLTRRGRGYPSLAAAKRASLTCGTLTAAARVAELRIASPLAELVPSDVPLLKAKILANHAAEKQLTWAATAAARENEAKPKWLNPSVLGLVRHVAWPWLIKLLMPALPFRNLSNKEATYYARTFSASAPSLLERSRALMDMLLEHAGLDLERALLVIQTRIAAYGLRVQQLDGASPDVPVSYFEDVSSCWSSLRFGMRGATLVATGLPAGIRCDISDEAVFTAIPDARYDRPPGPPGLVIDIVCGGEAPAARLVLRAIPTHLEADCFAASAGSTDPVGSSTNPLSTPVRIHVEYADRTVAIRAVCAALFRTEHASEQGLGAELTIRGDRYRIVGAGFAIGWRSGPPVIARIDARESSIGG